MPGVSQDLRVSRVQRFSTADGPGIRTTVFLSGCNLRCLWCHNPETQSGKTETLHFSAGKDEVCGERVSVEQLLALLLKDRDFYKESGGGVTLSGGEPLLQAEGAAALLSALKDEGISTLVDTAGCVPIENFAAVLPFTDLFYYDLKAGTEDVSEKFTGGDLSLIAENLRRIRAAGANAVVRVPLVYGVNTDKKQTAGIAKIAKSAGVKEIDLLPYHDYGVSKYAALGRKYLLTGRRKVPVPTLEKIADFFRKEGFTVKTHG